MDRKDVKGEERFMTVPPYPRLLHRGSRGYFYERL